MVRAYSALNRLKYGAMLKACDRVIEDMKVDRAYPMEGMYYRAVKALNFSSGGDIEPQEISDMQYDVIRKLIDSGLIRTERTCDGTVAYRRVLEGNELEKTLNIFFKR